MTTPNRKNIAKWVAALRSGEYEQGSGVLARTRGDKVRYCCLGVASEISGVCTIGLSDDGGGWGRRTYDRNSVSLPKAAMKWLGVDNNNPHIGGKGKLGRLNDRGASFAKIADLIEAEWLS